MDNSDNLIFIFRRDQVEISEDAIARIKDGEKPIVVLDSEKESKAFSSWFSNIPENPNPVQNHYLLGGKMVTYSEKEAGWVSLPQKLP